MSGVDINFPAFSDSPLSVLLTCSENDSSRNACVWDPTSGTSLKTYKGSSSSPHTFTFVGDSFLMSAQPAKPILNAWAVNRHEQLPFKITTPGVIGALAASPSGKHIIGSVAEKIYVWQSCNGNLLKIIDGAHYQPITCIAFTSDGSHFVTAGRDGNVLIWSLLEVVVNVAIPGQITQEAGVPLPRHSLSDHKLPITDLHLTFGGGRSRVVTASLDQTSKIYCLASGNLLLDIAVGSKIHSVVTDGQERNIFFGTDNGPILCASLRNPPRSIQMKGNELDPNSFTGHKDCVSTLSVSLDGLVLASGSEDGMVKLWNIKSKECIKNIEHKGKVSFVRFLTPFNGMLKPEQHKPSLVLAPLKKTVSSEDSALSVDIFTRGCGTNRIPSLDNDKIALQIEDDKEAKSGSEIERVKACNLQLYKYAVENIINK